jgi:hypothetical protein
MFDRYRGREFGSLGKTRTHTVEILERRISIAFISPLLSYSPNLRLAFHCGSVRNTRSIEHGLSTLAIIESFQLSSYLGTWKIMFFDPLASNSLLGQNFLTSRDSGRPPVQSLLPIDYCTMCEGWKFQIPCLWHFWHIPIRLLHDLAACNLGQEGKGSGL